MKKILTLLLCLVLLASLLIGCKGKEPATATTPASAQPAKTFTWRFQTANGENEPGWFISNKLLKKVIEEATGGRVKVELYTMGTIANLDTTADATAQGACEMGEWISGMAANKSPACLISEAPYGARDAYENNEIHRLYKWKDYNGVNDVLRKAYWEQFGVYYLTNNYFGSNCLFTTFPIKTLADLKGKRILMFPHSLWLEDFGAISTDVPGFDVYMGLKLGTVDGIYWTLDGIDAYKLHEVAKYVMLPSENAPNSHAGVNKKAWEAIGPELQYQIQAAVDGYYWRQGIETQKLNADALALGQQKGMQIIRLRGGDEKKFLKASRKYWNDLEKMDNFAADAVNMCKEWMKYRGIPWE